MTLADLTQLDDCLRAERQSFDRIPVVDIAPLLDGSDPQKVARDIRWAFANAGFMYVKNHGIAPSTVDAAFDQARAFFDLPIADKMSLHVSNSSTALRGYIELFGENTDPVKTNDLYLANLRRVVNTCGRERNSIPFFIDADYDAVFEPLESCSGPESPARYAPVTCGARKSGRFVNSYSYLQQKVG